jgi:hypothetical protein
MQGINYEKTLIGLLYEWPTTKSGDGRMTARRPRSRSRHAGSKRSGC